MNHEFSIFVNNFYAEKNPRGTLMCYLYQKDRKKLQIKPR